MTDLSDPTQFKQQIRSSFDQTSPQYGTNGDFHWAFAQRLVDRAPLRDGHIVLDVATGTAAAALLAAQIVGPQGNVVGVDLSPGILEHARRNIAAAGATNIDVQVGDAEELDFPSEHFDGVLCSSSIVWFPDISRALHEWNRVLRPGGWIAFSCFGGPARHTINTLLIDLLKPYGYWFPEVNMPLNTSEKCRALVQAAGFTRVDVLIDQEQQFTTDPEASFTQAWASRSRFAIELLPEQLAQLKAQYIAHFALLVREQERWNRDYEQFVVAYKAG